MTYDPETVRMGDVLQSLNALYRRIVELEKRISELEARRMAGGIEGLEGEWTITPPPEWEG